MRLLLIIVICSSFGAQSLARQTQRISIEPESKIYLKGNSNINQFKCELCNGESAQELDLCYAVENGDYVFDANKYVIDVDHFLCENPQITRDLKKALKIEEYPHMYLEIERLDPHKDLTKGLTNLKITLAGQSNSYCLPYEVEQIDVGNYRIEITSDFTMTEFGIEPPTALLGLIKVEDEISIRIDLVITLTSYYE